MWKKRLLGLLCPCALMGKRTLEVHKRLACGKLGLSLSSTKWGNFPPTNPRDKFPQFYEEKMGQITGAQLFGAHPEERRFAAAFSDAAHLEAGKGEITKSGEAVDMVNIPVQCF